MKAYKTELAPNNEQTTQFERFAEARRFVFNIGLLEWQCQYGHGNKPSAYGLKKQFTACKYDHASHDWNFRNAINAPYAITEGAFHDLGIAFQNFFRRVKRGGEKPGYPKLKHRANSFKVRNTKIGIDRVRITHVGWVRLKERNYIPPNAEYGTYATISRQAGRWYISMLVKDKDEPEKNHSDLVLGLDFGIKSLVVCSDGTIYENPRPLRVAQQKLKRLQRELARRKKGGCNWQKTKQKLQCQHARVANIRKHILHQISHDIIVNKSPSIVVIEDLNVSGMMRNHCLAQAISDVGFGELRRQIEYKAKQHGVLVTVVSQWFPSSKACSGCGCIKDDLTLADRLYICKHCGLIIDRDYNAALNLAAKGEPSNGRGLSRELRCSNASL